MSTPIPSPLALRVVVEEFPLKEPFHITGYTITAAKVVTVVLEKEGLAGHGEASGVYYREHDDIPGIVKQIEAMRPTIEAGIERASLQRLLPKGGARNALDCALWDLEAKLTGRAAWQIAGMDPPRPLLTTFTLGANHPDRMAMEARRYADAKAIKLKLTGEAVDADRVRAVRAARPDIWLGVDANQGFSRTALEKLLPVLIDAGVALIEQPFAVGREGELDGLSLPIPVAADESAQDRDDLSALVGRFDVVNIKLDKCGGLTEGLAMAREARQLGLRVMVGNMASTSLATAPSFLLGQLCDVVDLDGPALLSSDRPISVSYKDGMIFCPDVIWGGSECVNTTLKGGRMA